MRFIIPFIFLFASSLFVSGQAFQCQNTFCSIVKTTAQSPAHWYLELDNLVGVDTTLRWKADLSAIPAGWDIYFDDQDLYYPLVHDGDSADFTLFDSLPLPQKLIIGAFTNNIPASVSAFFSVYNPADTAAPVILEYAFDITLAAGLEENALEERVLIHPGYIEFLEVTEYRVVSVTGQSVLSGKRNGDLSLGSFPPGIYVLLWDDQGRRNARRFCVYGN